MIKIITFSLYALTATDAYQLDSGLTGPECIELAEMFARGPMVALAPGISARGDTVTLTCEVER